MKGISQKKEGELKAEYMPEVL